MPVWRRITTRPVTLGGVDLPEGAKLFLWLASTGRDGDVFPSRTRFDPARENAHHHLAFGKGIHYCAGASLGKLEARLALAGLTGRCPGCGWSRTRSSRSAPTSPSAARWSCGWRASS